MTETPTLLLLSTLAVALVSTGCRDGEITEQRAIDEAAEAGAAATAAPSEGVAYEPAYPADVSAEGLSDEDVAQQQVGHTHDGEEHSHDDGSHTHDEDEPHDDGDHDH